MMMLSIDFGHVNTFFFENLIFFYVSAFLDRAFFIIHVII